VGGVGLRGPGETQLEVDRRDIRRRIDHLKDELEKVRTHRQQYRQRRKRSRIPLITLVGYTNAGKSTLLNRLAQADVYVADQLFATLDPTTRRVELPGGHRALFTDTVGFIQKLPTELVAAFRATLEEIADADLLVHLIDSTHMNAKAQAEAVHQTLAEIEADHIPVLTVLNKIDRLGSPEMARQIAQDFPNSVAISALTGLGIDDFLAAVNDQLFEKFMPISVHLPYQQGALISQFHELGQVERVEHVRGGVNLYGKLPGRLVARYRPFMIDSRRSLEMAEQGQELVGQASEE
jgi:GTP-binding protein HflX